MNPSVRGVPWLNVEKAAEHLGLTKKAMYHFLDRERAREPQRLKVHWLNGRMRFRQADLDRCVEEEPTSETSEQAPPLRIVGGRGRT